MKQPVKSVLLKYYYAISALALHLLFLSFLRDMPIGCKQQLEVACNNILRKIWSLPRRCHTSILHLVASVQSIYNSTIIRSNRLVIAAIDSSSRILADVFCESSSLTYTSCGYNCLYGPKHTKSYNEAESLCASFIRDVRMSPSLNTALLVEINHNMCTV